MMELMIGGSGSGKSARAEDRICFLHRQAEAEGGGEIPLIYIADMIPSGEETLEKIRAHKRMRSGKGFHTLEWYTDLPGKIREQGFCLKGACVLLECISNLTANEMYMEEGAGDRTVETVTEGVRQLKESCLHLVVVTNDVFGESVPDTGEMRRYKEYLGEINQRLGEMADQVTEVISGVPVSLKGNRTKESCVTSGKLSGNSGICLITGGAYQGKRAYGERLFPGLEWADGETCGLLEPGQYEGLDHFHLFVRRWLEAGKEPEELIRIIQESGRLRILVCDETGCGLVPMDPFERRYRETLGRICTRIAGMADCVYRVVCGIGIRIRP